MHHIMSVAFTSQHLIRYLNLGHIYSIVTDA